MEDSRLRYGCDGDYISVRNVLLADWGNAVFEIDLTRRSIARGGTWLSLIATLAAPLCVLVILICHAM
ncbi:hypothetical protein GCM10027167_44510 [Nocardia heshunensis]